MKLPEARRIAAELLDTMAPYCERIEIAGSIRRCSPLVGDIELVCIPRFEVRCAPGTLDLGGGEPVNLLWDAAGSFGVACWEKQGPKYRRGVLPGGVAVDIFTAAVDSWGCQLAIRTGRWEFSKALVTRAKAVGLPCEGGFLHHGVPGGPVVPMRTEEEFFARIGVAWVDPDLREGPQAVRFIEPWKWKPGAGPGRPTTKPPRHRDTEGARVHVELPGTGGVTRLDLMRLRQILARAPGESAVVLHLRRRHGEERILAGFRVATAGAGIEAAAELVAALGGRLWVCGEERAAA